MDAHGEFPMSLEDLPASLPRTCSNPDLTELFKKTRSARSQSQASTRRSENNISENSQILYMAESKKSKTRKARESLSSIGNCVDRRFDGSSDEKEDTHDADSLSWDVIDQEIYEWQYLCQTGKPYWWSPESRYTRLKRYQPILKDGPGPRMWMRGLDCCPKPAYAEKRRAVSDNYFCDPKTIHDLAHLVAVQLLGACFTLPPDHILGMPSPNYTIDKAIAGLPDPRMISSLRMHTQFRYSPSFGNQARNTSPVQAWPRAVGGPSPSFSPPTITDLGPSIFTRRRTGRRRTLNVHGGSGSCGSLQSDGENLARSFGSNDGLDPTESTTVHLCQQSLDHRHSSFGMPNIAGGTLYRKRRKTKHANEKEALVHTDQFSRRSNYRLEPVIRSEPHHVFIQPVRELVVKRWSNFKRRLSGSLHSALPTRSSEDRGSASEIGSPAVSSDGKARRLRAQERGDIHSSDVESTPHFNTPTSGNLTPSPHGWSTPDRINGATFRLSNPSIAEAALIAAEDKVVSSQAPVAFRNGKHVSPSESSVRPMGHRTPPAELSPTPPSRPGFPLYTPPRFNQPAVSKSFSSSRRPNRQKRKSALSEMFTADDVQEPSVGGLAGGTVSSAPSTAHATPVEEENHELGGSNSCPLPTLRDPTLSLRPTMGRTNTSGSQIFTPADDGIELDGLPVGPPERTWSGYERRERTYL